MSSSNLAQDDLLSAASAQLIELGLDEDEARLHAATLVEEPPMSKAEEDALRNVLRVLKIGDDCMDCDKVKEHLLDIFSNVDILEDTFRSVSQNSEVDFSVVMEFYEYIRMLRGTELEETLVETFHSLFEQCSEKEEFPVCAWLILLFCPAFLDPQSIGCLLDGFLLYQRFSVTEKLHLQTIVLYFTAKEMTHFLQVVHGYLTLAFATRLADLDSLLFGFDFLKVLFEVNLNSNIVSHADFYNPIATELKVQTENEESQDEESEAVHSFVLFNYPFLFDTQTKHKIFQTENARIRGNTVSNGEILELLISRQYLLSTAIYSITKMEEDKLLLTPFRIRFEDEDGIDEGGLTKEFFRLVFAEMFNVGFGMFFYDEEYHFWWFRSCDMLDLSNEFRILGLLIGLAVFNKHVIDLKFPLVFYKKLLGYDLTLEDLRDIFPEIYRNLRKLLDMDCDVSCLGLCFCMDVDSGFGQTSEVSLIPNGENIDVTSNNKHEYVRLYTKYLLETKAERDFNALKSGFETVCQNQYLKLFHPAELEEAICGTKVPDFANLRENVMYLGYNEGESVVEWLWEILNEYADENKRRFLSFVTGTDRVPLGGFGDLPSKFLIQRSNRPTTSLPVAATCINRLSFPRYETKESLRDRLDTALKHTDEGFGLG